ncbi:hypothetical protein NG895_27535 [Aeoliella sp. ICT_H6.2]|uniref:Uncharacterized protein n=1 Tax=Aeoliella straminimaris TaxID=2954799 RepID=A0A9X2FG41_9BACT|nr:hypothetical protein [Aeoliella straminimaris]MCO6047673.1 hypothetical protein [Aeoliella straminimaris]
MGFTIYYRSAEVVDEATTTAVKQRASSLSANRSWLSCEPLSFWATDDDHLEGGSKPNFMPDADPVAVAESEGMADGTAVDLLDVLCQLSQEFGITWEMSHDGEEGTVGYIRDGVCDAEVKLRVETFAQMSGNMEDFLGGLMDDFEM